jgi:hypothetical protein
MLSLSFSRSSNTHQLEVFLQDVPTLRKYQKIEVTVSYYPYQQISRTQGFHFEPYEDYVSDLADGKRSTYQEKEETSAQVFGLLLGATIFGFFAYFNPALLISVESFVSIFASYTVGKELWRDLDLYLQNTSKSWKVRWIEQTFYYALQQFGTLQRFWQLARFKRFGYTITLPSEIDFISHSSSKTVEMSFEISHFALNQQSARVLRILLPAGSKSNLKNGLVIIRFGLVESFGVFSHVTEYYQASNKGSIGTLNLADKWFKNKSLQKKFWRIGRLVWFTQEARLTNTQIISQ